ncbi:hypothetical protein ABZZ79_32610 [Streptomyces sp. NPDC006458]|uniref:hypothetical protein n=1 Tax=Streptomyces sp. NPDC006458 TaxID=3154302 RepID=UPI00339DE470
MSHLPGNAVPSSPSILNHSRVSAMFEGVAAVTLLVGEGVQAEHELADARETFEQAWDEGVLDVRVVRDEAGSLP